MFATTSRAVGASVCSVSKIYMNVQRHGLCSLSAIQRSSCVSHYQLACSRSRQSSLDTLSVRAFTTVEEGVQPLNNDAGSNEHILRDRTLPDDPYRSRVGSICSPRPRSHPVVWGDRSLSGPLTPSELETYERQGYLQFSQLLSNTDLSRINNSLDSLLKAHQSHPDPRIVTEPTSQEIRSIFEIHKTSPTLLSTIKSSRLPSIARQILSSDVYIHQSRVNFKPAFVGKGFYWHSDFETWHAEDGMPTPRALSFSISLTDNTAANGPLMLIPASHRTFVSCVGETPENHHLHSLREQEIGVPDQKSVVMLARRAGGVHVVTGGPGSAVVFDSNCMHGSAENISPAPRWNLFVVFNSVENKLGVPYYARTMRPEYIAARDFEPV